MLVLFTICLIACVFSKENQQGGVGSYFNILDQFCSNVPSDNVELLVRQNFAVFCEFESRSVVELKKNLSIISKNVKSITSGQPTCFEVSKAGLILYEQYKTLNDPVQKREILMKWNTMINKTVFFYNRAYDVLLNNTFEMTSVLFVYHVSIHNPKKKFTFNFISSFAKYHTN